MLNHQKFVKTGTALGAALGLFFSAAASVSAMQDSPAAETAEKLEKEYVDQANPEAAEFLASTTPDEDWQEWLNDMGLSEGPNRLNGRYLLVMSGRAIVPQGRNFISRRQAAFNSAILDAKNALALTMSSEINAGRSLEIFEEAPGEISVPGKAAVDQMSVLEKMATLSEAKIDQMMQELDPDYDGTARSPEERQKGLIELQTRYREKLSQQTHQFLTGAVPVLNIEGMNADGEYEVLVGMMWSPRSAMVASAVVDDRVDLPVGEPVAPIAEQIKDALADDPQFLAVSQGVRLWRDENGQRVLVSFAPVDRSPIVTRNRQQASLIGNSQIAQFVAEGVESITTAETDVANNVYGDGSIEAQDSSSFYSKVSARSRRITLEGVQRIYSWTGAHPNNNEPMQVDVYAWSPAGRDKASGKEKTKEKKKRRRRSRRGAAGLPDGAE